VSRRLRIGVFLPALGGLAALLAWAVTGLPDFGHYRGPYGDVLNRIALPERHTTNVVAATVFDYRGLDTLGEEFILFAAVVGVLLLLRTETQRSGEPVARIRSEALRVIGVLAIGPAILVGLWVVAFGYVTPGGGFQGGVALAGGLLLLYVASGYRSWHRLARERAFDPLEGIGVAGYVCLGLAALASGSAFLENLLGPGKTGTLWSGGSIGLLNGVTALEVFAANVLLFAEFLEAFVAPVARRTRA
jgi:multicomponent Na+:H+ antiporter subunit B